MFLRTYVTEQIRTRQPQHPSSAEHEVVAVVDELVLWIFHRIYLQAKCCASDDVHREACAEPEHEVRVIGYQNFYEALSPLFLHLEVDSFTIYIFNNVVNIFLKYS